MFRKSKTEFEKLETKKQIWQKKLDTLQAQLTAFKQEAQDMLLTDADPGKLLSKIGNLEAEIQSINNTLALIAEAQAKAEPEHLRIKLAEIKKEMGGLNDGIGQLEKDYESAKKAYLKAESALVTAKHRAMFRWQQLSRQQTDYQHHLRSLEGEVVPMNEEPLYTHIGNLVAKY